MSCLDSFEWMNHITHHIRIQKHPFNIDLLQFVSVSENAGRWLPTWLSVQKKWDQLIYSQTCWKHVGALVLRWKRGSTESNGLLSDVVGMGEGEGGAVCLLCVVWVCAEEGGVWDVPPRAKHLRISYERPQTVLIIVNIQNNPSLELKPPLRSWRSSHGHQSVSFSANTQTQEYTS